MIDVSDFNLLNQNIYTGITPLLAHDTERGSRTDRTVELMSFEQAAPRFDEPILVGRNSARSDLRNLGVHREAVDRILGEAKELWSVTSRWETSWA